MVFTFRGTACREEGDDGLTSRPTVGIYPYRQSVCQEEKVISVPGRVDQGRATRERLVEVATELFATHGYEDTSIEAVLDTATVSRGSLYHHFRGKEALFDAVLGSVEARIGGATSAAAAQAPNSVDALRAGCHAWIELASDRVVQQIVLIDALSVLGWRRCREIQEHAALGLLKAAMLRLAAEGHIASDMADVFAHIVFATMSELALLVMWADDTVTAQHTAAATVDEFLTRLLR